MFQEFLQIVPKDSMYNNAKNFLKLKQLAKRLNTQDIHNCNGTRYNKVDGFESLTRARQGVYVQIERIIGSKCYYYHQSDPRGASLYISRKNINDTNYTNGLAIY